MRVLFQNRGDIYTKPGGDTVQMLKTKEGLERLGVRVDIADNRVKDFSSYALVHLFNIITFEDTLSQMEQAKAAGKTVVVSPIWWTTTEYEVNSMRRPSWNRLRRLLGTHITCYLFDEWRKRRRPVFRHQRRILTEADLLLPNSTAEMRLLVRCFGLVTDPHRFHMVPYAVDKDIFQNADPTPFIEEHGIRDFVLCVARIENRKNQLQLIRAMRKVDAPLVLIGQENPNQPDYVTLCKALALKLGPQRVRFIHHIDQKSLASAYAAAKVHVLPSMYETCGLTSLEAAVTGCNIVTTDRAPVDEYLGEFAWRCNPFSARSIRKAIEQALYAQRRPGLAESIATRFTWENVANETLKGYESILARSKV